MYLSECCDALPFIETYENMGKCSRCKEDTMFYEEELLTEKDIYGQNIGNSKHGEE